MQRFQIWLLIGAVFAGLAVATGAYRAHGLEKALKKDASLDQATLEKRLDNWETAANYQMYHGLGLLAVGLVAARCCGLTIHLAGTALTLGTLIFSGCLYAIVLTGETRLGAIVPIGGLLMIVGWLLLAIAILRLPSTVKSGHDT